MGEAYRRQIELVGDIDLVLWVDRSRKKSRISHTRLSSIEELADVAYDAIVIAVEKKATAEEIRKQLVELGVQEEKVHWSEPLCLLDFLTRTDIHEQEDEFGNSLSEYTC